ncbi:hypothetical protein B0H14DRAFT_2842787, partial [Mycena olivaceomarginata]
CAVALASLFLVSSGDWLAHGRAQTRGGEERKEEEEEGGQERGLGAWTGAAARERHYLLGGFTPPPEAACRQLHAALVSSMGRNHARHYPLSRVPTLL